MNKLSDMNYDTPPSTYNNNEVWEQLEATFLQEQPGIDCTVYINQGDHITELDIEIDLGGGFESGYEVTTLTAQLQTDPTFKFAIHEKHFTDTIGKFFGMEDIEIGYPTFDEKLIIKTNDPARTKAIFADAQIRSVFESLHDFTLGITHHHVENHDNKATFLELSIDSAITDTKKLEEIYNAFYAVLVLVDSPVL